MKRIRVHSGDSFEYLLDLDDDSADIVYFDPMFDDGIEESNGIAPLRKWAHSEFTLDGALNEALRVARKRVVLKDHWKSPRFEKYGFRVKKRKTALFHYGVLENEIPRHIPWDFLICDFHDDKISEGNQ